MCENLNTFKKFSEKLLPNTNNKKIKKINDAKTSINQNCVGRFLKFLLRYVRIRCSDCTLNFCDSKLKTEVFELRKLINPEISEVCVSLRNREKIGSVSKRLRPSLSLLQSTRGWSGQIDASRNQEERARLFLARRICVLMHVLRTLDTALRSETQYCLHTVGARFRSVSIFHPSTLYRSSILFAFPAAVLASPTDAAWVASRSVRLVRRASRRIPYSPAAESAAPLRSFACTTSSSVLTPARPTYITVARYRSYPGIACFRSWAIQWKQFAFTSYPV